MLEAYPLHCPLLPLDPLPRLTADLPGCGGQLRAFVEDFQVEEIPLYEPAGSGDHLYLWIEKIDVAADTLRRHVARSLGIPTLDVGMAGLKDRRAVTRQWVSVPRACEPRLERVTTERIRVLDVRAHRNKLRTGHLAGNKFRIRLRGTVPAAAERVAAKLALIEVTGMPNFYGAQRMGHGGSTLAAGWAVLQGARRLARVRTPDDTVHSVDLGDRMLRRLAASALQAEIFNRTVAERLRDGTLTTVLDGDVCRKCLTGGMFVTDDVAREQARLAAGELELTAPMWGTKTIRATQRAGALEAAVLAAVDLDDSVFAAFGALAEGTRRPMVVRPQDVSVETEADGITLVFSLAAGSFATVLVHELSGPLLPGERTLADDPSVDDLVASGDGDPLQALEPMDESSAAALLETGPMPGLVPCA